MTPRQRQQMWLCEVQATHKATTPSWWNVTMENDSRSCAYKTLRITDAFACTLPPMPFKELYSYHKTLIKTFARELCAQRLCTMDLDKEPYSPVTRPVCNNYTLHQEGDTGTIVCTHIYINAWLCQHKHLWVTKIEDLQVYPKGHLWFQRRRRTALHLHWFRRACLELMQMSHGASKLLSSKSPLCITLASGPTSNQTCKWRQTYTSWSGRTFSYS